MVPVFFVYISLECPLKRKDPKVLLDCGANVVVCCPLVCSLVSACAHVLPPEQLIAVWVHHQSPWGGRRNVVLISCGKSTPNESTVPVLLSGIGTLQDPLLNGILCG